MKIIIGCDHAGVDHKTEIVKFLKNEGYQVKDLGTHSTDSVDYPDYAHAVSKEVLTNTTLGILICGTGNGVGMVANKYKGIRAGICWNKEIAALTRQHNNANIISLPSRFLTKKESIEIIRVFLREKFEGGRHEKRVNKI